jgi:formylglycine-generating enzyme
MKRLMRIFFLAAVVLMLIPACKKSERSATTGWAYNDQKWGGFEKLNYEGQIAGPNLVLIEGGTFSMGVTGQDVTFEWNNVPRRVTVSSFYMDETEVSNIDYREFIHWRKRVFGESYPAAWREMLPDTLVWREELAFNEPMVETYFRHPSYDFYPVVGVTWAQAEEYCKWRTDRVNEMLLIERGVLNLNTEQADADNFNTESYLFGQYEGNVKKNMVDKTTGGERPVKFEDGILLPSYRLPTEAEWEYAALALQGNLASSKDDIITDRRIYPWDGASPRYKRRDKHQGSMLANFKIEGGNYMGTAGKLNDKASFPHPVRAGWPNDFGLYNMAGNVSEWVADIYRPLTSLTLRDVDNHDLNPFRGNRFDELILDEDGNPIEKDSLGRLQRKPVEDSLVADRENYKRGDLADFRDGDDDSEVSYLYGETSLINEKSRVIKGGSWADRLYWLSPGTRRFKDEDKSDKTLGFRCAMIRVGSSAGNEDMGGHEFGKRTKPQNRRFK